MYIKNDIDQKIPKSMETPHEIAQKIADRFYPLPETDLEALASVIEPCRAVKGEYLLFEGQISRYLYYIESGLLRQFYYKNEHDITEHFSCEGDIAFCLVSLFREEPTMLMIEALEPTLYHRISYAGLKKLLGCSFPLNNLYQKLLEWSLILSQRKADSWRFETVRERYLRFQREYPQVAKRASVNHIASYLLMTPESLSRVRSGVL